MARTQVDTRPGFLPAGIRQTARIQIHLERKRKPIDSGLLEQALSKLSEQYRAQVDAAVRDAVAKALEREIQQLRQSRPDGR